VGRLLASDRGTLANRMTRANALLPLSSRLAAAPRSAVILLGPIVALIVTLTPALQVRAAQQDLREAPPGQLLAEGKPLFNTKGCARCHSIRGGKGEQRVGPDLGRDGTWCDIMQFAGGLWNHTPTTIEKSHRPAERPTLSPNETGELAAFLFFARFVDEPGDIQRGRELFEQRLCIRCHQLRGHGGTVGPRLDELSAYASSFFLAQALWNHGPEMAAKMEELRLGRPRLERDDAAQIVAFIRGEAGTAATVELAYAEAGSPRSGETVFRDKGCIKCHAISGKGGAVGPDLGKRRPAQHVSELAGALWNHGPSMWAKMKDLGVPFPRLSEREMANLLAYLHFVAYMGAGGDATRGSTIFREKSCSRCHAVGGEGAKIGPDLAASDALRSSLNWASAMWNHSPAMEKKFGETQPTWPRFTDDEMADLVEFLRSQSGNK
jgi:mono/diheme cytochrome c family protein